MQNVLNLHPLPSYNKTNRNNHRQKEEGKKGIKRISGKSNVKNTTIGKPVDSRTLIHRFMSGLITRNRGQIRPEAVLKSSYLIRSVRVSAYTSRFRGELWACVRGLITGLRDTRDTDTLPCTYTRDLHAWTRPKEVDTTVQFRATTHLRSSYIDRPDSTICHASCSTPSFHCFADQRGRTSSYQPLTAIDLKSGERKVRANDREMGLCPVCSFFDFVYAYFSDFIVILLYESFVQ